MYEAYYGLRAKPFQLKPDPLFFFASKGHKRASAYLQYGISQGEGFIVITGEVGAGKTTLVRNMFRGLDSEKIVAAQIVNTHLNSEETLKMVAAAFGLPVEDASKAILLTRLERFFRSCDMQGKRALLVVDEAQNLSSQTVEELRMLSNFQTTENFLLQTFLLGQPEFRKTLMDGHMQQLRQRVIASYHLGPMGGDETRTYIEHRLRTVGWNENPSITDDAFATIHESSGGIPRKINTLCDRLFLMGYLEELQAFDKSHVDDVIRDIEQEFQAPVEARETEPVLVDMQNMYLDLQASELEHMDERLSKIERAMLSVIDALKRII